jgi:hypothetical protein
MLNEQLPLFLWKLRKASSERHAPTIKAFGFDHALERPQRQRLFGQSFDEQLTEPHAKPLGFHSMLENSEIRDPAGPGHEVTAVLVILRQLTQGDVGVLKDVVSVAAIDEHSANEGQNPRLGFGQKHDKLGVGWRFSSQGKAAPHKT